MGSIGSAGAGPQRNPSRAVYVREREQEEGGKVTGNASRPRLRSGLEPDMMLEQD